MSCDPIQQVSKLCVTTVTSVSSGSNQYKRTSSCSGTLSLSILLFHDSRGKPKKKSIHRLIMASASSKVPPKLSDQKCYADWVRLISLWSKLTDLDNTKRGPAIVMSLSGKALETVLELTDLEISADDGPTRIISRLDNIFKKDDLTSKFSDFESFESYKRSNETSIQEFLAEFDRKHSTLKKHGVTISDDLLGFKLMKAANLSSRDEQLIKATVTEIKYENIKSKIKSTFSGDNVKPEPSSNDLQLKSESAFQTQEVNCEDDEYVIEPTEEEPNDIYYTQRKNFRSNSSRFQRPAQKGPFSPNWRSPQSATQSVPPQRTDLKKPLKGRNPIINGEQSKCVICQSINHWADRCPDKTSVESAYLAVNELVLLSDETVLKTLVAETWDSAVLDTGATSNVCGKKWLEEFVQGMPDGYESEIKYTPSRKAFRFGDGKIVESSKKTAIPVKLGGKIAATLTTDIVDADLPLLLSLPAMKKAGMHLHLPDDSVEISGLQIPITMTSNGLISFPLTDKKRIINNIANESINEATIFKVVGHKTNSQIATKLHRVFAHPPAERLLKLIESADPKWSQNRELKDEVQKISDDCTTCKIYKKPPPRPVVSLAMAEFNETVAMDLKEHRGKIILHLIDMCTRLSQAIFIPNKKRETIIQGIFKIWISVNGSPNKFLTDNGGEFANEDFLQMCEAVNVQIHTTPAESPWSNGVVERHNQTLANMMDKILEDHPSSPELALLWAINAKNSLQNVAGFTPFQLALGRNPKLPSTSCDMLPALSSNPTSQIIKDHLNALHTA